MRNKLIVHFLHRTSSTYFYVLLSNKYVSFKEPFHPDLKSIYEAELNQGISYTREVQRTYKHPDSFDSYTSPYNHDLINSIDAYQQAKMRNDVSVVNLIETVNDLLKSHSKVAILDTELWKSRSEITRFIPFLSNVYLIRNPVDWILSISTIDGTMLSRNRDMRYINPIEGAFEYWIQYINSIKFDLGDFVIILDKYQFNHAYRSMINSLLLGSTNYSVLKLPVFKQSEYNDFFEYQSIKIFVKDLIQKKGMYTGTAKYFLNYFNLI